MCVCVCAQVCMSVCVCESVCESVHVSLFSDEAAWTCSFRQVRIQAMSVQNVSCSRTQAQPVHNHRRTLSDIRHTIQSKQIPVDSCESSMLLGAISL